ncbi:MAG: hypothetical protein ACUVQV_04600, partial [Dissulfurimicrobium sp.]|uniref:hypothetical protein n=1 Tax=Dissulfurimicrobium sp. TaxID=2022436 RepID=UPI004049A1AE
RLAILKADRPEKTFGIWCRSKGQRCKACKSLRMRGRITIRPYSVRRMGEVCSGTNRQDSRFALPKAALKGWRPWTDAMNAADRVF